MIAATIRFLIVNFTVTLFLLGLAAAAVRIASAGRPRTTAVVSGALLDHFILFSIVVGYVYNAVVHSVFGDFSARVIGWPQSSFQLEVAFASLGFALVGLLAFSRHAGMRVKFAAVLGITPFLWGAAGGHIYQTITTGDVATGNAGPILYTDLLLPVFGLAVLWLHHHSTARERTDGHRHGSHEAEQAPADMASRT